MPVSWDPESTAVEMCLGWSSGGSPQSPLKYKTYEMIFFFLYICLEAGFGLKMSYMKDILCTWNYLSVNFEMFTIWCLSSVQFSRSVVSDSATLWTVAHQASLSISNSWSLPKLMSIESVMPSNYPILCCPLSPPAFNLSQYQDLFQWVGSSHQVAKVLELQLQHQHH